MTDKNKTAENRRKLLKTVAAGGGAIIAGRTLPEKWGRPVVDSVMLPAHAQASAAFAGAAIASIETDSMFARVLDTLVPQSHAVDLSVFDISWCVTPDSSTAADVYFLLVEQNQLFAELWSASGVAVGSTPTALEYSWACSNFTDGHLSSAGEWLNNLGLIRDAKASDPTVEITLSGLDAGDNFRFTHGDYAINLVRPLDFGPCGPRRATCVDT